MYLRISCAERGKGVCVPSLLLSPCKLLLSWTVLVFRLLKQTAKQLYVFSWEHGIHRRWSLCIRRLLPRNRHKRRRMLGAWSTPALRSVSKVCHTHGSVTYYYRRLHSFAVDCSRPPAIPSHPQPSPVIPSRARGDLLM